MTLVKVSYRGLGPNHDEFRRNAHGGIECEIYYKGEWLLYHAVEVPHLPEDPASVIFRDIMATQGVQPYEGSAE